MSPPPSRRARSHRYVIAYDVNDARRRRRIATALEDIGLRVGLSVFELQLTARQRLDLNARLLPLLDTDVDRILLYRLCPTCHARAEVWGQPWSGERRDSVFV